MTLPKLILFSLSICTIKATGDATATFKRFYAAVKSDQTLLSKLDPINLADINYKMCKLPSITIKGFSKTDVDGEAKFVEDNKKVEGHLASGKLDVLAKYMCSLGGMDVSGDFTGDIESAKYTITVSEVGQDFKVDNVVADVGDITAQNVSNIPDFIAKEVFMDSLKVVLKDIKPRVNTILQEKILHVFSEYFPRARHHAAYDDDDYNSSYED